MQGVVPDGYQVVVGWWQTRDFEVRPRESSHAPGNVRDPLTDDSTRRVERLPENAQSIGALAVLAREVATNATLAAWLWVDAPLKLEPVLPPSH